MPPRLSGGMRRFRYDVVDGPSLRPCWMAQGSTLGAPGLGGNDFELSDTIDPMTHKLRQWLDWPPPAESFIGSRFQIRQLLRAERADSR